MIHQFPIILHSRFQFFLIFSFTLWIKFRSASQVYSCFKVLQWIEIFLQYSLALTRKSICSALSSSFNHALVFRENGSGPWISDSLWIIFRVFDLSFSISLHHPTFITVLLGHPVFSSIPLNQSGYSFWIFSVAWIKVSSFHP